MPQHTRTLRVPPARGASLRELFAADGWDLSDAPHAFFRAKQPGAVVTAYCSGKVLVQGTDIAAALVLLDVDGEQAPLPGIATPWTTSDPHADGPFAAAIARLPPPAPTAWIGIDETGKGDYFGPLVSCAARVSADQLGWLAELGVGDSKKLTDKRVAKLAAQLRDVVPHAIVRVGPARYNELYDEFRNLNRLLAWTHAKAAEELLERVDAELILSDEFSKKPIVPGYFGERAKALRYAQRPKAEEDPAVACASIFARDAFLRGLERLGREVGVELAKGAGTPVLAAGRRIVAERGREVLAQVAKLHFKTTDQIGGR